MNIFQKVTLAVTTVATAGFIAYGGFKLGQADQAVDNDQVLDLLVEESQAVSLFELEVIYLALALYGEAKGQPDEWETMTTAIFNRLDQAWTPDTLIGMLLQKGSNGKCQIVAMCDEVPDNLTSEIGQAALAHAQEALVQYDLGTYKRNHNAHSWATPTAADGHAYFEDLSLVTEGSGHQYFGDQTKVLAPVVSLRPQARLVDPVMLALMEAYQ